IADLAPAGETGVAAVLGDAVRALDGVREQHRTECLRLAGHKHSVLLVPRRRREVAAWRETVEQTNTIDVRALQVGDPLAPRLEPDPGQRHERRHVVGRGAGAVAEGTARMDPWRLPRRNTERAEQRVDVPHDVCLTSAWMSRLEGVVVGAGNEPGRGLAHG